MDEDAPRQKKEALSGKTLMVSGRIYQKEKDKFYLTSVIVHENAAILQQENSKQEIEFKENDLNAWNIAQYVLMALTQNSHNMFSKQKREIFPKQPNSIKHDISINNSNKKNNIREKFEKYTISFNKKFKNKNNK